MDCAESDPDAKRLLNIVVSGKANNIAYTLRMHRNSPTAKVTLTTAHKSKGLEWDEIIVANDFASNYDKKTREWVGLEESERVTFCTLLTHVVLNVCSGMRQCMRS